MNASIPGNETGRTLYDWIDGNTAVDELGLPLPLFHGTAHSFLNFNGMAWGSVDQKLAHEYAEMRSNQNKAEPVIKAFYLNIKTAFDADQLKKGGSSSVTVMDFVTEAVRQRRAAGYAPSRKESDEVLQLAYLIRFCASREESGPYYSPHNFWCEPAMVFGKDGAEAIFNVLSLLGYDGIHYTELGIKTYGAFSNEQVLTIASEDHAIAHKNVVRFAIHAAQAMGITKDVIRGLAIEYLAGIGDVEQVPPEVQLVGDFAKFCSTKTANSLNLSALIVPYIACPKPGLSVNRARNDTSSLSPC